MAALCPFPPAPGAAAGQGAARAASADGPLCGSELLQEMGNSDDSLLQRPGGPARLTRRSPNPHICPSSTIPSLVTSRHLLMQHV